MASNFSKFSAAIPWPVRWLYRKHPIVFVLKAGEQRSIFEVNLYAGSVRRLEEVSDEENPLQIHTSTFIMRRCLKLNLFSHLGISKRVVYQVTTQERPYAEWLEVLIDLYDYEVLPWTRNFTARSLETWSLRWREILLYGQLVKDLLIHKDLRTERHLLPRSTRGESGAS